MFTPKEEFDFGQRPSTSCRYFLVNYLKQVKIFQTGLAA